MTPKNPFVILHKERFSQIFPSLYLSFTAPYPRPILTVANAFLI